jgi:phosphoribosylglycinamide formyltransferase-1
VAVLNVVILISGRGSNMQALVEAVRAPGFPARVVGVISNVADAPGLAWASAQGVPTAVVDHKLFGKDRQKFEEALDAQIVRLGGQLVLLAGFMRLLTGWFVTRWLDRLVNIHPSLLPAFPGLHVHEQALAYGVKFTGCTVHFVRAEMDHGPIIAQAAVPVHQDDTPDTLAARVLESEHVLYPAALRLMAEGRVNVHDERVFCADVRLPDSCRNPLA